MLINLNCVIDKKFVDFGFKRLICGGDALGKLILKNLKIFEFQKCKKLGNFTFFFILKFQENNDKNNAISVPNSIKSQWISKIVKI